MKRDQRWRAMALAGLSWLGCTARPPSEARGIELDEPQEPSKEPPNAALIAAAGEPSAAASEPDDSRFVQSREPKGEWASQGAQLPIHINETWWPFRAKYLGMTEAQTQRRDAELSEVRPAADFWDAQLSVEAVSVWTVLCNECHGGRRSMEDAREMPAPPPTWAHGEGLFFGRRGTYREMFNIVKNGGPARENRRAEMPAWRNILSTEMIWALLYFLEYQSGGIESRFPPSLYPRRPKVLGRP